MSQMPTTSSSAIVMTGVCFRRALLGVTRMVRI
jgi:hypothetical protein